ncbi:MAG: hypothetical protein AMXMBFR64_11880 [Myxococcales bacterium]
MTHGDSFLEVAAILGMATILAFVGQKLRQPLIIMFLATGIFAGPSGFAIIESHGQIELLAHIGIALLLFIVGLKLDLNLIRTTGPVALATGVGQIVFTSAIGLLIALAMGMGIVESAYVAVALTFSSTIIIVKLLSDKKEIDSLHGQIAIGFLIVQDIAAILALVALTTFGGAVGEGEGAVGKATAIAFKGVGLLVVVGLLMRFVLPWLTARLARNQELLTLFAIAWAVVLGAGSEVLGFSKEVGAFLAGVSLASTGYRDAIGARLTALRDFLLLFFFIDLGARLDLSGVGPQVVDATIFSVFVLVGNPLIVLIIMGVMGYRRRTAFLAGLTVAQISEFSLIVAALGLSLGHISAGTMSLITLVGVVTIFASTYLILYSGPLYKLLSAPLRVFERRVPFREAAIHTGAEAPAVDVILVGLGSYGSSLAAHLVRRGMTVVGVDFDPAVLVRCGAHGMPVFYGDVADPEMHELLPLGKARWVVSTIRQADLSLALLELLRGRGYEGRVAVTAPNQEDAGAFERAGANVVLCPFTDAAEQAADALAHAMDAIPDAGDWPLAFREVRVHSASTFGGHTVREIPLRARTGTSILAVSRGGRVHYDPGPEFRIYPGDRLVLTGQSDELRRAESLLGETLQPPGGLTSDRFALAELHVGRDGGWAGQTLAALQLRQRYGVTVVGIRRGAEQISHPGPADEVREGDRLLVIGSGEAIAKLREVGEPGLVVSTPPQPGAPQA